MSVPSAAGRAVAALALAALVACGDPSPPQPPDAGEPAIVEIVTGRERMGWDQRAGDHRELQTFQFAVYVDGVRLELAQVSCETSRTPDGFPCSAPLPPLRAGERVLELAAFVVHEGVVLESPRSAPLRVNVVSAAATAGHASGQARVVARDATQLRLELVVPGLSAPTAIAFAPDGRLFVAERRGRVSIATGDRLGPALELGDLASRSDAGLLAMALHPRFERTRFIYLVDTIYDRDGRLSYRLARYREVGNALAERAILLDGVPAGSRPSAAIAFGRDGKLYLALGDDDPRRAADLAALGGKLLRINEDGSTPDGNPWRSPVYMVGAGTPRAFDWQPDTGALWLVEERQDVTAIGVAAPRGDLRRRAEVLLSRRAGAATAVFYDAGAIEPFRGDLFVAADEGRHIARIRPEAQTGRPAGPERLLLNRFGRISSLAVGPDGALYFATGNATPEAPGLDIIARLVPDR